MCALIGDARLPRLFHAVHNLFVACNGLGGEWLTSADGAVVLTRG